MVCSRYRVDLGNAACFKQVAHELSVVYHAVPCAVVHSNSSFYNQLLHAAAVIDWYGVAGTMMVLGKVSQRRRPWPAIPHTGYVFASSQCMLASAVYAGFCAVQLVS